MSTFTEGRASARPSRSAGKGSRPRPIKGDTYRRNYARIFRKNKPTTASRRSLAEAETKKENRHE